LATPDQVPDPRRTDKRPRDKDRARAKVKDRAAIDVVVVAVVAAAVAKVAKVVKAGNRAIRTVPLTHP
jgi:hypothetical protein